MPRVTVPEIDEEEDFDEPEAVGPMAGSGARRNRDVTDPGFGDTAGGARRRARIEADANRSIAEEFGLTPEEVAGFGVNDIGDRRAEAERVSTERRTRQELEQQLADIRSGNTALRGRADEAITLGTRGIRENERVRLQQTEASLSALNMAGSPLGERVRRAERETTALAEADLQGRVRIQEMDETFKAEMAAIERLFANGQANLGYLRQVRLLGIQAEYARELADIQNGNAFFNMLGDALGTIASIGIAAVNPAGIFTGGGAEAAGERVL